MIILYQNVHLLKVNTCIHPSVPGEDCQPDQSDQDDHCCTNSQHFPDILHISNRNNTSNIKQEVST